jgi:hypothetical protein
LKDYFKALLNPNELVDEILAPKGAAIFQPQAISSG